jgi:hypothetical protein
LRFNLVLDDVSITHVAFSPEFTHAVEAKQVSNCTCSPKIILTAALRSPNKLHSAQLSWSIKRFKKNW